MAAIVGLIVPHIGSILSAAAVLTGTIVNAVKKDPSKELIDLVRALERQLNELQNANARGEKDRAAAEARFRELQETFVAEQTRKEEQLKEEKQAMENAQAERERLMDERCIQWERKQKEMIEAEKDHQRVLAKEAEEGLKRSHAAYERQRALDQEQLAKEEQSIIEARQEHKLCLEKERERLEQSQANHEQVLEEDRQRHAHELKTFQDAQKKGDTEREVLKRDNDELQRNLAAAYEQLRHDQSEFEKRLHSKIEDLKDEQKNLNALEKEQKLKDLTEDFKIYCERNKKYPEKMTEETEKFQRKFQSHLIRVKNSMQTGGNFLPRLDIWVKGVILDMQMITFLTHKGKMEPEDIQEATRRYRNDMGTTVALFDASNALPSNVGELRAIEQTFHDGLQEIESYSSSALTGCSTPLHAIQAPAAMNGNILPPTGTEDGGAVPVGFMSGSSTRSEVLARAPQQTVFVDNQRLPGDDRWAKCDALAQSLQQSSLADPPQHSSSSTVTRGDAFAQSLQQSSLADPPQHSSRSNLTRSDAPAQSLQQSSLADPPQHSSSSTVTRGDALAQSLQQSSLADPPQHSSSSNLTRSDALAQSLQQSSLADPPQHSSSSNVTRSDALAQSLRQSANEN